MGDNQNNINRFPLTTFVFIPFADSICDDSYAGKETSSGFSSIQDVSC